MDVDMRYSKTLIFKKGLILRDLNPFTYLAQFQDHRTLNVSSMKKPKYTTIFFPRCRIVKIQK